MDDDLVTIATFQIPYRADLAKGMLESAGFEVFLLGENYGRQNFFHTAYAPIRLQVKASDEAEARKLLAELEAEADLEADPEP